jgi:general L-amino acid transport system substrate-binding protein
MEVLMLNWRGLLALYIAVLCAGPVEAGPVQTAVKARGSLRCGVSEGIAGFSIKNSARRWSGFDADFCRAVAAAAIGDGEKVLFVPLRASARFPALQTGSIDVLVRQTTWTLGREAALKARFVGVLLYDGQAFVVPKKNAPKNLAGLDGAAICVEKGTTHAENLVEYFSGRKINVTPLIIDSAQEVAAAFFAGRCRAYTSDASQLSAMRATAPAGRQDYLILPERISKEPLGPAVRAGDEDWLTLVRWVLFALVAAEEGGVTQANVRHRIQDPALTRTLGSADEFSNALGVSKGWAVRVIESVGNYGEMFERNLGSESPLKLDRDHNRLWTQGGLMYSPPMR